MWIENHNIDELPKDKNREKNNIQKYEYSKDRQKERKDKEQHNLQQDNKEANRLIASVNFDVTKWKKISKWKVDFTIADISWNIDIDNDKLTINDKVYDIKMPKWANLIWITVLSNWNIKVEWESWGFTGSWNISDDIFIKEMIRLSSYDIQKDIIKTKSWDLILSRN